VLWLSEGALFTLFIVAALCIDMNDRYPGMPEFASRIVTFSIVGGGASIALLLAGLERGVRRVIAIILSLVYGAAIAPMFMG
jgi:hypothetical protein